MGSRFVLIKIDRNSTQKRIYKMIISNYICVSNLKINKNRISIYLRSICVPVVLGSEVFYLFWFRWRLNYLVWGLDFSLLGSFSLSSCLRGLSVNISICLILYLHFHIIFSLDWLDLLCLRANFVFSVIYQIWILGLINHLTLNV